ncbi:MAG: RNA polymerase sigma-70 factor [Bacteroidales bacterium]|jgi:RNA polymerase sigma-70 factor (ECF subfamily)|nr:RNA polymerase sigma-70 factor [Bacteroidales bacterium]
MGNNFLLDKTLKQLANDDKNALEKLFNYYYPRLYSFSKTLLKLDEGIEDILQEVFLRIYQNRKNIKSTETFQSYIFTITRNLLLNELRSQLNEHKAKEKIYRESVAREYLLSEKIEFLELQEKLEQIIETLPDRRREIYLLSRKEGLSHKEIAVKLDISEKTVEYHITQSLSEIKKKMREIGLLAMLYFYFFL